MCAMEFLIHFFLKEKNEQFSKTCPLHSTLMPLHSCRQVQVQHTHKHTQVHASMHAQKKVKIF